MPEGSLTRLRLAYENHVDAVATTVTASSSATKFPAVNVQSAFRQVRWRSTGDAAEWLQFDFGSAKQVSAIFLLDHNLTADAVVELLGSSDPTFVANTLIQTIIPTSPLALLFVEDTSFRYYRITIADPANPAGYVQVGRVFLGPYVEAARNYNHGYGIRLEDLSQRVMALNGVEHYNIKPKRRSVALSFECMDRDQRDQFEAFATAVGMTTPFFACLNVDEQPVTETLYCTLDALPEFVDESNRLFSTAFSLREAL